MQGGAGAVEVTVALRNVGTAPCTLDGFPGLALVGADGGELSVTVQPGGPLRFEQVGPTLVTLAAGATAYANVGLPDTPTGGQAGCPTVSGLAVTPPGATTALSVPVRLQVCTGSAVHVSAVFAASSAAASTMAPPTSG